ncbi:MAG: HAD family phosphatase [Phenylobacterium sp.]|uniref:HAD family hydrolase n=1 Tax=Phenylobacterium sp. TaxID=1871053 RepID=UPI002733DD0E|nr:HAD family phosphatase [Phenylobacterium sp.]MDP3175325.1 HAD family phosphatase [Phenylobacterium sp.]
MTLPRRVRAVVFDMDGLLVDTEGLYSEALSTVALRDGVEIPPEVLLSTIGNAWAVSAELLRRHFAAGFNPDAFRLRVMERFHEMAQAKVALKAGVLEILQALDDLGLPRAIATSSQREDVEHHIGGHALLERFDAVLAHGDYARSKPAPDPYLAAAAALGAVPRDCLALEDSHNGVRAAHAAGMMTIMIPDLLDPTEEMRLLCVRVARDLHEVEALLRDAALA